MTGVLKSSLTSFIIICNQMMPMRRMMNYQEGGRKNFYIRSSAASLYHIFGCAKIVYIKSTNCNALFVWKMYILWSCCANICQILSTVFVQTDWVYFSLSDFDISGTAQILIRGDTFLWQGCQIIPSSNFLWLGLLPRSSSETQMIKRVVFGRFKTEGNDSFQTTIFVQL